MFRVDASIEMGAGHVMRCLTLADELSQNGHKCTFISRRQPGSLINLVKERGYSIHELPECEESEGNHLTHGHWLKGGQEKDVQESLNVLEKLAPDPDWLVIDHYGIDKFWEQRARNHVKNILVIDDLADRSHDCDILVDQNLGQTNRMYQCLVPENSKILTGCGYALLRSEFANYREQSLKHKRETKYIGRLIVTMGGVDKDNYTGKVLEALEYSFLKDSSEVIVVLGEQAPWLEQVKEQAEVSRFNITIASNVNNMAELMATSDLAIGAAGSTSWERCCLGVPSIMCVIAENQKVVAKALSLNGGALLATGTDVVDEIRLYVNKILENANYLNELSEKAKQLVDGKGTCRVVKLMMGLS